MEILDRKQWKIPEDKWKSDCPLCKEENLCIWEWKHLKVIHNKYAVNGLKNHYMLIPKRHIVFIKELNDEEILEIREAEIFLEGQYGDQRYFSFTRNALENRSLEHLHYHYMPGNIYYSTLENMMKDQGL